MTAPVNETNRWFVQMDTKIKELQDQIELVIPYLRDMQERGDNEAKFLLNMLGDNS